MTQPLRAGLLNLRALGASEICILVMTHGGAGLLWAMGLSPIWGLYERHSGLAHGFYEDWLAGFSGLRQ
jgi:hypothetical protein